MAIDPKNRPVRVISEDTTEQELAAGQTTPGGDPPKNEAARGGFGNREGREGYGTDTANGITALGENRNADETNLPPDNILSDEQGRNRLANQDMPDAEFIEDADLSAPRRPANELELDDTRQGLDEMQNPDSRVGMGQMEQPQPNNDVLARQGTNADLTDPTATDTAIDQ